ncbi:MAG: hypothetical protein ACYTFV_10990, partial [Planctomycetota bacterium]
VDGSAAGYEALLLEHSTGYQGVTQGRTPLERIARRLGRPLDLERVLAWEDPLDWESLLGRTRSASYVIHEVADRARYEAELRAWFEAEQHGGLVRMPYPGADALRVRPGRLARVVLSVTDEGA